MTLVFEKVSIKNFGPYRKIQSMELSVDANAPVVLIHGENTLGKTRFFRALRWCLYGSPTPEQSVRQANQELREYLNYRAADEGENTMQVSIQFRSGTEQYVLSRRAVFGESNSVVVSSDLRIGGTVMPEAQIEVEIGKLLHPQISEFFLFDGELLKDFYDRLNTDRERDMIRRHIDTVLGIPALQYARTDVGEMASEAVSKQVKAVHDEDERKAKQKELAELKSRQESLDKDKEELQRSLSEAQQRLRRINEELAGIENLQLDAREMEQIELYIKGDQQKEATLRSDMRRLISQGWLSVASRPLNEKLLEVQAANTAAVEKGNAHRQAKVAVEALRNRIAGGTCPTCSQELPPPDEQTREKLRQAEVDLEALGPERSLEGPDLALERTITRLIDGTSIARYTEKQQELNKVIRSQRARKERLQDLQDNLRENDAAQVRKLAGERETLDNVIGEYEEALRKIGPKEQEIRTAQERVSRTLDRIPGPQPSIAAEANFFQYLQSLLHQTIARYQYMTRTEVEQTASRMFLNLVSDPQAYKGIRIGDNYEVELINASEEPIETSEGGKQLVALSLIGALKEAAVRGGPVVLDSPLARLDLGHRARVLDIWVSSLGDQVVLLVQSGELTPDEARKTIGERIGREYRIFRPNGDPEEAQIERIV